MLTATIWENLLQAASLVFAAVQLTRNAFSRSSSLQESKSWMWLAFGVWVWLLGQLMESYAEVLLHQSAYGTVADGFWLIGIFAILRGLFLQILLFSKNGKAIRTVCLCCLAFLVLIVLFPVRSDRAILLRVLDALYATTDLASIGLLCALVFTGKATQNRQMVKQWSVFLLGALLGSIGDILWASGPQHVTDLLFVADYVLVGISATLPMRARNRLRLQNPSNVLSASPSV